MTKIVQDYEANQSRKNSLLSPEDGLRADGMRFDAHRPFLSTLELNAQKKGVSQILK